MPVEKIITRDSSTGRQKVKSLGVLPSGGTLDQILVKGSSSDGDGIWKALTQTMVLGALTASSISPTLIAQNSTNKFVTDAQISTWNAKANATDLNNYLLRSGGIMGDSASIQFGYTYGVNYIKQGNGDGASYSTYNLEIGSWWGIGMKDQAGNVNGYYNARQGLWAVKKGYHVGDIAVLTNVGTSAAPDIQASVRKIVNQTTNDGLHIGHANAGSGPTKIFNGGNTKWIELSSDGSVYYNGLNVVINTSLFADGIANVPVIANATGLLQKSAISADFVTDNTNKRFVTDTQISAWNTKANATDLNNYLPLNGGIMADSAAIRFGYYGINHIKAGNGDASSYTTYNLEIQAWNGIGMKTHDGSVNGYYNAREGFWATKKGYLVGTVSALTNVGTFAAPNIRGDMRILFNNHTLDGMYIGQGNAGNAATRIYGGNVAHIDVNNNGRATFNALNLVVNTPNFNDGIVNVPVVADGEGMLVKSYVSADFINTTVTKRFVADAQIAAWENKVYRTGDVMTGLLEIRVNTTGTAWNESKLMVTTTDNSTPSLCLHRAGYSAVVLYESAGQLFVRPAGGAVGGKVWSALNHGAGSGLDADMLDGYHANYFTNVDNLSTNANRRFVSDAQITTWNSKISGVELQEMGTAKGGSATLNFVAGSYAVPSIIGNTIRYNIDVVTDDSRYTSAYTNPIATNLVKAKLDGKADLAHSHAWGDITGKPSSFAPSAHSHAWDDITGKPTSFTPSAHSHAWGDITGKPTEFPPSAHTHTNFPNAVSFGDVIYCSGDIVSGKMLSSLGDIRSGSTVICEKLSIQNIRVSTNTGRGYLSLDSGNNVVLVS